MEDYITIATSFLSGGLAGACIGAFLTARRERLNRIGRFRSAMSVAMLRLDGAKGEAMIAVYMKTIPEVNYACGEIIPDLCARAKTELSTACKHYCGFTSEQLRPSSSIDSIMATNQEMSDLWEKSKKLLLGSIKQVERSVL